MREVWTHKHDTYCKGKRDRKKKPFRPAKHLVAEQEEETASFMSEGKHAK